MSLYDVRFVAIAACFLVLPSAFSQRAPNRGGTTQPPAATTPAPNPGMGDPSLPGGLGRQQQAPQFPQETRPIYLSGRVVVDDGTPPPDTASRHAQILALPQTHWSGIRAALNAAFAADAGGRAIPVFVTEYNLTSSWTNDDEQLMTRAVNALFIADSLGQMMQMGVKVDVPPAVGPLRSSAGECVDVAGSEGGGAGQGEQGQPGFGCIEGAVVVAKELLDVCGPDQHRPGVFGGRRRRVLLRITGH
jgi:hypothetical protein